MWQVTYEFEDVILVRAIIIFCYFRNIVKCALRIVFSWLVRVQL